ncbi:MAG: flagellar filament protein FlaA [Spirochaetaceae bacterium]|nr:flagellar filament protein FlaA [Spirochaetaceae bacterium]
MKRGSLVCISLVLIFTCFVPLVAQPSTKSIETILVDSFDSADNGEFTWEVQTSKFIAEGYPKMSYVEGIPNSLRPLRKASDPTPMVLGVLTSFDRKGDNWFEVVPMKDGAPYEIPLIGKVAQLDFWAWGSNYVYDLEVLVRDADGRVHVIPAGKMTFNGWRNFVISIPGYIRQQSRLRSGPKNLTFVGFKVKSDPDEYVDNFAIYFDQLKYSTHTLHNIYDGFDLNVTDFDNATSSAGGEK